MSDLKKPKNLSSDAELLKVLGHPLRLCIVENLIEKQSCNVSFIQCCLNAPQSTISQHIAKLKSAGIIVGKRNGLEINYSISDKRAINIIKALRE